MTATLPAPALPAPARRAPPARPAPAKDNHREVQRYYSMAETRLDFGVLTGGTRHYGLYRPGDWAWNWPAALRRMEDRLADRLRPEPGDYVLDAGCGAGDAALRLAASRGCRVLGVDIRRAGAGAGRVHVGHHRGPDAQMLPMARCFARLARPPVAAARLLGCTDTVINAAAAVEFWTYRRFYRYHLYTARRPPG